MSDDFWEFVPAFSSSRRRSTALYFVLSRSDRRLAGWVSDNTPGMSKEFMCYELYVCQTYVYEEYVYVKHTFMRNIYVCQTYIYENVCMSSIHIVSD